MSRETASVEETEESSATSVMDLWRKWYDIVGLAGVVLFMLWVRVQSFDRFTVNGEILFSGNDAYYHFREISYTVEHWPWTMPFDPWTGFPYGTSQGQFGTLYDQIVATTAMIVGLGDPSQQQIAMVTVLVPAVFGALTAIPIYYIGRRLRGRGTGLFAALLLAIMPGTFLRRSTVGFADHQVAEIIFVTIAILAFMIALRIAETELPVYEQIKDRDWAGLKRPVAYSALAGLLFSLYLSVWPPGVFLIGMLGIFFTVVLTADFLRGRSPDHVATVGMVSMSVVAVSMLVLFETTSFTPTRPSLLHVLLAIAVLVWCALLAAMARLWEHRDIADNVYPATVFGLIAAGLLFTMVALPSVFDTIVHNISRAFLFGQSDATLTVAEAKPTPGASLSEFNIGELTGWLFREYGFTFVISFLALGWLTAYTYLTEYRSEYVLLIIWTLLSWLMALSQVRFHYYLVLPMVLVTAWAFGRLFSVTSLGNVSGKIGEIETYQVLTVLVILLLVFAPLLPPFAVSTPTESQNTGRPMSVLDAGKTRPSGTDWASSANWMESNTPQVGMDYYGTYQETDDFEYPDSAYGVMAWWDYGHWITVLAERIPHANPFQQNAPSASSYFQATSERRANLILDAVPSMQGSLSQIDEMTNDQLQQVVANQSEQHDKENIRYVMIDDQTASGKFLAIRRWANPPGSNYFTSDRYRVPILNRQGQVQEVRNETLPVPRDRFKQTMVYKLYYQDAEELSHYRLVQENSQYSIVGGLITNNDVRVLNSYRPPSSAYNGWSQQLANQSDLFERRSQQNVAIPLGGGAYAYNAQIESSVKVFERVPGATVTGRLANTTNASVVVKLQLETGPGRPFAYYQTVRADENGEFNVTVPYATTDGVGPGEGGTDTNVTAVGNYSVFVNVPKSLLKAEGRIGQAFDEKAYVANTFEVTEQQIYEGGSIELGTFERPTPAQNGNQSQGNQSQGNQSESGQSGDGGSGDGRVVDDFGGGSGSLTPRVPAPQRAAARSG